MQHKVDMLFKLIEDHHQQQQIKIVEKKQSLINVSDDESGESDEEYDSESEIELSVHDEHAPLIHITEVEDFSSKSLKELKKLCSERGYKRFSNLKKEELVKMLDSNIKPDLLLEKTEEISE